MGVRGDARLPIRGQGPTSASWPVSGLAVTTQNGRGSGVVDRNFKSVLPQHEKELFVVPQEKEKHGMEKSHYGTNSRFPGLLENDNPAAERSRLCLARRVSSGRGETAERFASKSLRASDKTLALLGSWATFLPSPKSFS